MSPGPLLVARLYSLLWVMQGLYVSSTVVTISEAFIRAQSVASLATSQIAEPLSAHTLNSKTLKLRKPLAPGKVGICANNYIVANNFHERSFTVVLWFGVSFRLWFWYGFEYDFTHGRVRVLNLVMIFATARLGKQLGCKPANHIKHIANTYQNNSFEEPETYQHRIEVISKS